MRNLDFEKARYELKYAVELKDYELEHFIKMHPANFSEIFYERQVNSLYFDSVEMNSYKEHVSGLSSRFKIRIRWYGKIFGAIKNPRLEIKSKNDKLGNKHVFPIKTFIFDKNFSSAYIQKILKQSKLPEAVKEELKLYLPVLLTSYKRKYFVSADKKYRITIDKDLKFLKVNERTNLFLEKASSNCIIMEIKYSLKNYDEAKHITENFPFRFTAFSKYVSGFDVLFG